MKWSFRGKKKGYNGFLKVIGKMRKRLSISRIIKEGGKWAEGNEQVAAKAISFLHL